MTNLIKPILTEKTMRLAKKSQFTFAVEPQVSQEAIAETVAALFKVDVLRVNKQTLPAKSKRSGKKRLPTIGSKRYKAIVTLKPGQSIEYWQTEDKKKSKKKAPIAKAKGAK
jgi:ribosomal protein L23